MADNEESRAFNARAFEFGKQYPKGFDPVELARHAQSDDLDEALFALGVLQGWAADREMSLVFKARIANRSWSWIGSRLGRSRQALWERYKAETERNADG